MARVAKKTKTISLVSVVAAATGIALALSSSATAAQPTVGLGSSGEWPEYCATISLAVKRCSKRGRCAIGTSLGCLGGVFEKAPLWQQGRHHNFAHTASELGDL